MKLRLDKEANALYLAIAQRAIVESEEVHPGIVLDFDAEGIVVGIEVLQLDERLGSEPAEPFHFESA